MRNFYFFSILVSIFFLVSCNENELIYNPIQVDESFVAEPIPGLFQKNALIEDYTGTWCGNCTRVSYAIEKVQEESDRVVTIAIHNGNDPYHFVGIEPLKNLISHNNDLELPQSRLNRTITWTFPEVDNIQQALNLTSNNCGLGLALNSTVANGNLNITVKVKLAQNYENIKLVVYVLENKLYYRQFNYTSYFNEINPILNFEHNHVLRNSLTQLLGDAMTNTTFNQTLTTEFSLPIPTNISNADNISFAAFVVDENNTVINAREAYANENQNFQENR